MNTFSTTFAPFFSCRRGRSLLSTYMGLLLFFMLPIAQLPLSSPAEPSLSERALRRDDPGPCGADPLPVSQPEVALTQALAAESTQLPYPRLWTVWQLWQ
ncbi:hypothetical protein [Cesiribacter andamanensis]|uniref:Uncharacterized protein n=1 Tax=Cesiribacter andamanensis AMV16 TaxID=1279009 RepID=M7N3V8_9BACT|nr:hypothetical protein [Cesiribacter andamanensis]EMR03348.1 hypothetical protein ADICEAN_01526 [Cesiribacter andamanensis AMV16]